MANQKSYRRMRRGRPAVFYCRGAFYPHRGDQQKRLRPKDLAGYQRLWCTEHENYRLLLQQRAGRAALREEIGVNRWIIRILLTIGYSVPYAFLSMQGDVVSGSMGFYGLMIFCFALLGWAAVKTKNRWMVIGGNILSGLSSYFFFRLYQTDAWGWYVKPLTPTALLLVISGAAFLFQWAFVHFCRVNPNRKP
ncbi:MAG: hypothetical protein RR197_00465 [Oscillospiraceae bacterium]